VAKRKTEDMWELTIRALELYFSLFQIPDFVDDFFDYAF
jgi:hypothetical protein